MSRAHDGPALKNAVWPCSAYTSRTRTHDVPLPGPSSQASAPIPAGPLKPSAMATPRHVTTIEAPYRAPRHGHAPPVGSTETRQPAMPPGRSSAEAPSLAPMEGPTARFRTMAPILARDTESRWAGPYGAGNRYCNRSGRELSARYGNSSPASGVADTSPGPNLLRHAASVRVSSGAPGEPVKRFLCINGGPI